MVDEIRSEVVKDVATFRVADANLVGVLEEHLS